MLYRKEKKSDIVNSLEASVELYLQMQTHTINAEIMTKLTELNISYFKKTSQNSKEAKRFIECVVKYANNQHCKENKISLERLKVSNMLSLYLIEKQYINSFLDCIKLLITTESQTTINEISILTNFDMYLANVNQQKDSYNAINIYL